MSKHAPAPWSISDELTTSQDIVIALPGQDGCVCIERHAEGHDDRDWPNAHLIAAAPDLLSAIKNARHFIDELAEEFPGHPDKFNGTWASYRDEFDAVIAKAEGA